MLSKQNPKITFVIYQDQKISRAFEFEKKKLRLIVILIPSLLAAGLLLCLFLFIPLKFSIDRDQATPSSIVPEEISLDEKIKQLELQLTQTKTLNEKYKQEIVSREKKSRYLVPLFHAPEKYQDLTDQKLLKVTNMSIKFRPRKVHFDFDIINEKKDGAKLVGHILIAMMTPARIILYPPVEPISSKGAIARFDQGETFTISRFRRVEAFFNTRLPANSPATFRVHIFSNTGDLMYTETIGPMNVEPSP